jgi:Fe-S-cluster containining protein
MSEKESFAEKFTSADTAEVEALWKEALREFMGQVGVPERYVEAEGSVLRHEAWTSMSADWASLPPGVRQQRYGELLEVLREAGYATRAECLRCGDCCRKSGPTLFLDDLRLFDEGLLQRSQVFTLRRGERVSLPDGGTMVLKDETLKVRDNPETGHCLFLDDDIDRCQIYHGRPLQCRAQACWDTSDIEHAITHEERLNRAHVIKPDEPVADAILAHESHCALPLLADAFAELAEGNAQAAESIVDALAYDTQLRPLLVEKLPLPAEELDFTFGRPLVDVIQMYGVQVIAEGDSFRLEPLAVPPAKTEDVETG